MKTFFLLSALACAVASPAKAEDGGTQRCISIEIARQASKLDGSSWTTLTAEQWQFARGVAVLSPTTPPGLPPGDTAALVQNKGEKGGIVLFIDGGLACSPLAVPPILMDMFDAVATGEIVHAGGKGKGL